MEIPIDLLNALQPILDAVEVNDSDTLSMMTPDSTVLWTASGSWSNPVDITLGDFRKIRVALSVARLITDDIEELKEKAARCDLADAVFGRAVEDPDTAINFTKMYKMLGGHYDTDMPDPSEFLDN